MKKLLLAIALALFAASVMEARHRNDDCDACERPCKVKREKCCKENRCKKDDCKSCFNWFKRCKDNDCKKKDCDRCDKPCDRKDKKKKYKEEDMD